MSQLGQAGAGYTYRDFRPADREGFLDLHEAVWGHDRTPAWFEWRFVDNPYLDHVPMVVAERDGEIVGAEPCLAFRLQVGAAQILALQPADWAVHPEHRREGVFTGMTETLIDRYADGTAELYYNFPNDALVSGLEKFDWTVSDGPTTCYRVQNPRQMLGRYSGSTRAVRTLTSRQIGRLVTGLARRYLTVRDRLRPTVDDVEVERVESVPVDRLTALYERDRPSGIHVIRDGNYYRWRFANPRWDVATYLARRDGQIAAACVTGTETRGGVRSMAILDVVPLSGTSEPTTMTALLGAAVDDAATADLIKVADALVPDEALRALGFCASDSFPFGAVTRRTRLAVRPTARQTVGTFELGGIEPTDPDEWHLSLADQDIA